MGGGWPLQLGCAEATAHSGAERPQATSNQALASSTSEASPGRVANPPRQSALDRTVRVEGGCILAAIRPVILPAARRALGGWISLAPPGGALAVAPLGVGISVTCKWDRRPPLSRARRASQARLPPRSRFAALDPGADSVSGTRPGPSAPKSPSLVPPCHVTRRVWSLSVARVCVSITATAALSCRC